MEDADTRVPCSDDPEIFFSTHAVVQRRAKEICNSLCLVRDECLERALRLNETRGVWGGMGVAERNSLKRRRPAA